MTKLGNKKLLRDEVFENRPNQDLGQKYPKATTVCENVDKAKAFVRCGDSDLLRLFKLIDYEICNILLELKDHFRRIVELGARLLSQHQHCIWCAFDCTERFLSIHL